MKVYKRVGTSKQLIVELVSPAGRHHLVDWASIDYIYWHGVRWVVQTKEKPYIPLNDMSADLVMSLLCTAGL